MCPLEHVWYPNQNTIGWSALNRNGKSVSLGNKQKQDCPGTVQHLADKLDSDKLDSNISKIERIKDKAVFDINY